MSYKTEKLNKNFSFEKAKHFLRFKVGQGDIPVIEIQNEFSSATISIQGAHVLSWVPAGEKDVIWVSNDATFSIGKSVRGGIPICWPWFGAHETNSDFPAHGFARTVLWQVIDTQQLSSGETQVTFKLDCQTLEDNIQQMWPIATIAEYRLTFGKTLTLELSTYNNSDQSITIGQALHTYFNVDDVTKTTVKGLDGKDYLDKTDDFKRKTQAGSITVNSEVDRVYLNTSDDIVIDDEKRKIIIEKQGSRSTIVWNPWEEVAKKMGDLGQDGYRNMLCVESANAAEDCVSIGSDENHTLHVTYKVENL